MQQAPIDKLDPNCAIRRPDDDLLWFDARTLGVEGRGYESASSYYDRFPSDAEGVVRPPVWELQKHSAGMAVRFVTDAPKIGVRWTLRFESLAMPEMPATGVSGLDLYRRENGRFRWAGVGVPSAFPVNTSQLQGSPNGETAEFILYLPLYNGVEAVEIGVPQDVLIGKAPPWDDRPHRPICFYGTSITHGGFASRPGMAYPSIIGRALNRPIVNLGFAGNGQSEPEVAKLLARMDPSVYVLDPLPNMSPQWVAERIEPLVQTLRVAHPLTPIVLVEHLTPADVAGGNLKDSNAGFAQSNRRLRKAHHNLAKAGDRNLHRVIGSKLLGKDFEGTVDGVHPTDVGFMRIADAIGKVLQPLVGIGATP